MRDAEACLRTLGQLNALGVRIAIDDFGTGYSNLLYLRKLPAHELKIDRSFVQAMDSSAEDIAIVAAVVALAHTMRLQVVAEGVETIAQRNTLERLGCDQLQGYLLGRPMDAERFIATVVAQRNGPRRLARELQTASNERPPGLHAQDALAGPSSDLDRRGNLPAPVCGPPHQAAPTRRNATCRHCCSDSRFPIPRTGTPLASVGLIPHRHLHVRVRRRRRAYRASHRKTSARGP
uniref:EAL domain-containing protein n=1 Tax=Xanthomonas oryzae pv. oryzae TaxID=64187 RepID=Q9L779_XANOO|nr:hypothetical protein [Xanthomonas oryzae pv. oryzae]